MSERQTFSITVTKPDEDIVGQVAKTSELSRSRIKHAMSCGAVWLEREGKARRIRRSDVKLQTGDQIIFHHNVSALNSEPLTPRVQLDETSFSIWYKPAGMPVSGSRFGDHTALCRVIEQTLDGRQTYLVHRLDRFTAGLIVVAHNRQTASRLAKQFRDRTVAKEYLAITRSELTESRRIDSELDGKPAVSLVEPIQQAAGFSLLNIRIETGRKHQIRRHLASIDHPIVGDRQYGGSEKSDHDLQLVAWRLCFQHPENEQEIESELPELLRLDLEAFIRPPQT